MKYFCLLCAACVGGLLIGNGLGLASAQKAERGTQQWLMMNLPPVGFGPDRLDVVDTSGACIYVMRGGQSSGPTVAVSAIPKTQLPQGAGCQ